MMLRRKLLVFLLPIITASCTDGFETINSDPNKLYEVTLQTIFPGTVYRTMNIISEINYNRLMSYSRYVVIPSSQKEWSDVGDNMYRKFYVDILRDLSDLESHYSGDVNACNLSGIAKTWKAFVYYQMTSLWGPVGMSDYGLSEDMSKRSFHYDSEEEVYLQMLDLLDVAINLFDPYASDKLVYDPVFGDCDINKWRKLANTLRLEIALSFQNINEAKAGEYVAKSMEHEDWLISSLDDALNLKYGKVDGTDGSVYYRQFYKNQIYKDQWGNIPSLNEYFAVYLFSYNDPRMEVFFHESNHIVPTAAPYRMPDILTRPHDCANKEKPCDAITAAEHLNLILAGKELRDSLWVQYSIPYVPTPDGPGTRRPFSWEAAFDPSDPNGTKRFDDPLSMPNTNVNRCYIKEKYYALDCELPLLTWADACFLSAEAKEKFGLGAKTAQEYYEQGIRASFEEQGIGDKVGAYLAQEGIAWDTDGDGFWDTRRIYKADIKGKGGMENHLEQIYKQRYFAGFLNCFSAWRMERRTRAFNFPPFFHNGTEAFEEGGDKDYGYPERFYFPQVEMQTNAAAYYEAIDILQQNSPEPNSAHWGDNVYTVLQFAKPVPDKEETIEKYKKIRYVDFNMDMQAKKYGKNYEEFVETARMKTGIIKNDEAALKEAFNFQITGVIKTYIVGENK